MYPQTNLAHSTKTSLVQNYKRFPVEFSTGDGVYLYDIEGNQYLDFLCGIAVTGFGHSNSLLKQAVEDQLECFWHVSNLFESSDQEILAGKLCDSSGLDKAFFCNSGTEANETAIKFARKWGGDRTTIITAIGGFHGRTIGSLSASAQAKLWNGFRPLAPGFKYVPFNDVEAIGNSITPDVAAVMLEPIQGEGGIIVPSEEYLKEIAELCEMNDILLNLDEIQTGMGRTGKMFAHQWCDVQPDMITFAKGIANGLPLGGVLCSNEVASAIQPGDHGSTFGGNPVAVAAANAVLNLLTPEQLNRNIQSGKEIQKVLQELNSPLIKEIRGKGLMIGIEFTANVDAGKVVEKLLASKVVTCTAGRNTLRLLPPYIISKDNILQFAEAFSNVLESLDLE